MNYLSVEDLSKSYDEKQLFEGLTFGLEQGQKAALVGVNGCGKSTLLRVISGQESPEKGRVSFRKGIRVSMLAQHPEFDEFDTVLQSVFSHDLEDLNVIRDYELALQKVEQDPENAPDLSPLIERMDALNAWENEHQVKKILGKLGIHDLEQPIGELSGGQRKRVALAQALVSNPDFLILDEPTNHLDLEIIEWLENYLATANLTLLMVTHDRYFLDKVTNEILEIDQGKAFRYKGNYGKFLEKKAERHAVEQSTIDKAKNLLKTELEWMRRQPKARGTKAKYRVEAFEGLQEKANSGVKAREMDINLQSQRQGKKILELKHLSKAFEEKRMLVDFSYVFRKGERVGLVGSNGVGKSTFLNLITQNLKPDSGEVESGLTTKMGFYTQDESIFDPQMKVIDVVKEVAEFITLADGSHVSASGLLTQFLFDPKVQYNKVGKLSGGEKRRLQLLRVLMANPNFLILDEPTNDLDIMTLNVLEDYLKKFSGCLMIVSHDRYFMDRLVDHLFVFEGQGIVRDFPGNYSDYRLEEKTVEKEAPKPSLKEEVPVKTEKKQSQKLSYKEKRELEAIDKELPILEEKRKSLEKAMLSESDYQNLEELGKKIAVLKGEIEEKEMRWLELSERD